MNFFINPSLDYCVSGRSTAGLRHVMVSVFRRLEKVYSIYQKNVNEKSTAQDV